MREAVMTGNCQRVRINSTKNNNKNTKIINFHDDKNHTNLLNANRNTRDKTD